VVVKHVGGGGEGPKAIITVYLRNITTSYINSPERLSAVMCDRPGCSAVYRVPPTAHDAMDRSAGLIRPVVQSWSANSRNCFLLETISSYTRQTAGTRCQHLDQQPQQQPQQQQQCCNTQELIQKLSSHWSKLQSHAARWSTNSTRQYGSWGTQQLQPVQAAHFSSSTASSSSDGRTGHHEPQQQLHGIHPSQQRLWGDLPSRLSSGTATSSSTAGLGYVEQQQQQQQQAILGEVIVQPMGQEDSNGFRPRALRRKTPQFQVGSGPRGGGGGGARPPPPAT